MKNAVSSMVSHLSHDWLFAILWTVAHQAPLSMGFSRKNTGVGCHALLQGIFPTQGLNPGVLHCRQILYHCNQMEPHSTWPFGAKDLSGSSSSSSSLCVLGCVRLFATPWTVSCQAPLSMGFSRKNIGVGCHFLLQGIFRIQEWNPGLLHCRQIVDRLSYEGIPRIYVSEYKLGWQEGSVLGVEMWNR